MKFKVTLLVLFLFSCQWVFAQQANNARQNAPTVAELESEIQQLQSENQQLNNQIQELKLDLIRNKDKTDLVTQKADQLSTGLENDLTHWWSLLSILLTAVIALVAGGLGILAPYLINKPRQKQLQSALEDALEVKKKVEAIMELINKDSEEAKAAAQEAKASQYFAEALAEKDPFKKKELFTKVTMLNPNDANAYFYRGNSYFYLGNHQEAIKDYSIAIDLNPNFAAAYNNRGNAELALGDYDEAKSDIEKALEITPNYAKAFDSRGELKFALGHIEGAVNDHTKAIKINPQEASFYRNRAKAYRKMAETETDETKKNEYLAKAEADEGHAASWDDFNR